MTRGGQARQPVPIIFDSDGGIDDAAALWWACTSPALQVVAVTAVSGNVEVVQAARNLGAVLAAADRPEVPVAVGAAGPLGPAPLTDRPADIHGRDGLGDTGAARPPFAPTAEPAAELLLRLVDERPGALQVVTTGPLSNLAMVLRQDPAWAGRVRRLVAMAGSARAGGNAGPWAEANVAHDPEAASEVVAGAWATPPLMIGLDVTHQATLTDAEFALAAEQRTPAAAFLDRPLHFYRPLGARLTREAGCPCHDLVAMMAVSDPGLVHGPVLPVAVDTGGSAAWGATVVDFRAGASAGESPEGSYRGRLWQVALEVDVERFRRNIRNLFGD